MPWSTPRTWVEGEIPSAATFNAHIRDNLAYLMPNTEEPWKEVRSAGAAGASLWANGWTDYVTDGTWGPCRFRRVGGWVQMMGLANGASATNATMFVLPSGYRPGTGSLTGSRSFAVGSSNAGGGNYVGGNEKVPSIFVGSAGAVGIGGANVGFPVTWFSIFCVFSLEQ